MVDAGDHSVLSTPKQIIPFLLMFGWYIGVLNVT